MRMRAVENREKVQHATQKDKRGKEYDNENEHMTKHEKVIIIVEHI